MKRNSEEISPNPPPKNEVINEYFQWLCDLVYINQKKESYWILAKTLYEREYYWSVPNDDNRGMDGKRLQEEFADEVGYLFTYDVIDRPCSVFEMLIALAIRVDDIMAEPGRGNRTAKWFWEILGNLGLDKYTDADFVDLHGTARVNHIINIVLERSYKKNGEGGLFPLKKPKKDQRKVEIWYQMCAYLLENYYVDGEIM